MRHFEAIGQRSKETLRNSEHRLETSWDDVKKGDKGDKAMWGKTSGYLAVRIWGVLRRTEER